MAREPDASSNSASARTGSPQSEPTQSEPTLPGSVDPGPTQTERARRFEHQHAPSLRALAYRMLGSRAETDDILQEAWLRWSAVEESRVQHDGAFLSRLVTNLCLDRLGSATARREHYVGVWLPEPLIDDAGGNDWASNPETRAEFAQDVSVAFLLALERLSPLERAAFLLHDVFDEDFEEIGLRLGRSAGACRQLASRARQRVRSDHRRRQVDEAERERLFGAFNDAIRDLDVEALARVLTADAVLMSDGGGRAKAVPRPLHGADLIAKTLIGFASLPSGGGGWRLVPLRLNGLPGCLAFNGQTGELMQAITLAPSPDEPDRLGAIYVQRNPDKLRGLQSCVDVTAGLPPSS